MLAFFTLDGRGAADDLMRHVAAVLQGEGIRLAGAVQVNADRADAARCEMALQILGGAGIVPIGQNLGPAASGCRLDPGALEQAVALAGRALAQGEAELLIVNKFGKQEAAGRGFRDLIGQAMLAGIPVLTAVGTANRPAFLRFSDGMAEELAPRQAAVLAWCRRIVAGG